METDRPTDDRETQREQIRKQPPEIRGAPGSGFFNKSRHGQFGVSGMVVKTGSFGAELVSAVQPMVRNADFINPDGLTTALDVGMVIGEPESILILSDLKPQILRKFGDR